MGGGKGLNPLVLGLHDHPAPSVSKEGTPASALGCMLAEGLVLSSCQGDAERGGGWGLVRAWACKPGGAEQKWPLLTRCVWCHHHPGPCGSWLPAWMRPSLGTRVRRVTGTRSLMSASPWGPRGGELGLCCLHPGPALALRLCTKPVSPGCGGRAVVEHGSSGLAEPGRRGRGG